MTPNDIITSFNGTVAAVKTIGELVKAVTNAEKRIELNNAVLELQDKIMQHRTAHLDTLERCYTLVEEKNSLYAKLLESEKALAELKKRNADFDRYRLIPVADGTLLHTLKESAANGEPPHWLCPHCFAEGKKGILQTEALFISGPEQTLLKCPACGIEESFAIRVRPNYA